MRGQFAIVVRIADERHGRVSRRELLAAGIGRKQIDRWVADGRLRVVHRGVYAVGHAAPSMLGDYAGAVLAGGSGAVLSHAAVVHAKRLLPGRRPPPEITVPTLAHRRRPGIAIHRVERLHDLDYADAFGIPMTTVPRTLLDMAPQLTPAQLARACHEAWVRHDVAPRQGRLPLAGPWSHSRATELPLPRLSACIRGGRRTETTVESHRVHVGRRLRARRADDRRA
jgi:hypothetical protein